MSVDIGTRLGSLEITAVLDKGGMGEVYRARDTKLKRDAVARQKTVVSDCSFAALAWRSKFCNAEVLRSRQRSVSR
jgi:hypothetical protein